MDLSFLETRADFLIQWTNSVTVHPREWAEVISKKFPHARIHRHRRSYRQKDLAVPADRATPGTIIICDSNLGPGVITLFDRWAPGELGSREYRIYSGFLRSNETEQDRLNWFTSGLEQICAYFKDNFNGIRATLACPPISDPVRRIIVGRLQEQYWDYLEFRLY